MTDLASVAATPRGKFVGGNFDIFRAPQAKKKSAIGGDYSRVTARSLAHETTLPGWVVSEISAIFGANTRNDNIIAILLLGGSKRAKSPPSPPSQYFATALPFFVRTYATSAARPSAVSIRGVGASTVLALT